MRIQVSTIIKAPSGTLILWDGDLLTNGKELYWAYSIKGPLLIGDLSWTYTVNLMSFFTATTDCFRTVLILANTITLEITGEYLSYRFLFFYKSEIGYSLKCSVVMFQDASTVLKSCGPLKTTVGGEYAVVAFCMVCVLICNLFL